MREYYNEDTGMVDANQTTITVSQYLDSINTTLKKEKARIVGEVSGIQEYPGRSYLYFSIKDTEDSSTIKCFMWKRDYTLSGVSLTEGVEVVISAYPQVYKPNGGLSLQVESVELVGEGALKIAYEKLKKQLSDEGLFDESRKRPLPLLPKRIGILTSKSGAVINDFLSNIGHFGFELIFVDTKVEGEGAVKDLLSGLRTLYTQQVDVLVVMRGGGSLESFQAFNNETIVRAVAKFNAPVITGIGHDKDAPLVSLVSDKNVSTPTAVANLLSQSWKDAQHRVTLSEEKLYRYGWEVIQESLRFVDQSEYMLSRVFENVRLRWQEYVDSFVKHIYTSEFAIQAIADKIARQEEKIVTAYEYALRQIEDRLTYATSTLAQLDPHTQLARGWSIVKGKKGIIRHVADVSSGEEVDIVVSDGTITSRVL